jgi:hypothetical protein
MNETIKLMLDCMDSEITKNYTPRTPEPNETTEQTADADFVYEVDFFAVESFKLGFLLGMEIAKK